MVSALSSRIRGRSVGKKRRSGRRACCCCITSGGGSGMGQMTDRVLDVWMVVVGLGSTGDGCGISACAGLRKVVLTRGRISGVVGVVGVVPYDFAAARSSCASR
jgi:hypothetical protein